MESGCYRGFINTAKNLLAFKLGLPAEKILLWRIYTDKDFLLEKPLKQPSKWTQPDIIFACTCHFVVPFFREGCSHFQLQGWWCIWWIHMEHWQNHFQVPSNIERHPSSCTLPESELQAKQWPWKVRFLGEMYTRGVESVEWFMLFFVCRFLHMSDCWGPGEKEEMDKALGAHIVDGLQPAVQKTCILHLADSARPTTVQDKLDILSSISNWHWFSFDSGPCVQPGKKPDRRFSQHLLFSPEQIENREGYLVSKHPPSSPRNHLLYYMAKLEKKAVWNALATLAEFDTGGYTSPYLDCEPGSELHQEPPPKKRKKNAGPRVLRGSHAALSEHFGIDIESISLNSKRPIFSVYQEQVINGGVIQWRLHEEEEDVVVLSDFDPTDGCMIPGNFVHVHCRQADTGELLMKCRCKSYNLLQKGLILTSHEEIEGSELYLQQTMTCMHCRFFKELLAPFWTGDSEPEEALTLVRQKAAQGLTIMERPVVLVGDQFPLGTTKLSVRGEDNNFGFVHLTFRDGRYWARCQEGVCSVLYQNKCKASKFFSLADKSHSDNMCQHLHTISQNWEALRADLPELFALVEENFSEEDVEDDGPEEAGTERNTEDVSITVTKTGVFDTTTGLWKFPALSTHSPRSMNDPELIG